MSAGRLFLMARYWAIMGVVVPDMHDAAHRKLKIQNSKFKEEVDVLRDRRKRIPDRKGI
jgi:hypothetical protein